jgi:hypothetical protein
MQRRAEDASPTVSSETLQPLLQPSDFPQKLAWVCGRWLRRDAATTLLEEQRQP